jgi:ring-1,2-phenylacetyl-CoA epoxidase subunit PaaE
MRVSEIRPDAEDSVALSLDAPDEVRGEYRGLAGQHVVLRTQVKGTEARRTYSLTSAPGEWPLRIAVRVHKDGLMSRHLAEGIRIGDRIDVLPPNGSLTPRFTDRRTSVGFASGCGITAVLAVARSVLASGSRFVLFYGNTSTGRAMCLEEVLGLKNRYLDRFAAHFFMSREPQEVELYNGRLDAERVRKAAQVLFDPQQMAECFICGPGTMIDDVTGALRGCGIEPERIHGEHFTVGPGAGTTAGAAQTPGLERAAATASTSATVDPAGVPGEGASPTATPTSSAPAADVTEVTLVMDGRRRSFTMRRNAETVLDAAARAGLELPFSCRAGVCSTCRTKVVRGSVQMEENHALEEWELKEGYVLACQSRATTPVLELDYDEK